MVLNVKISNTALIWTGFIIVSASFMRSVLNFLVKHINITGVSTSLWIIFAVGLIVFVVYLFKLRPKVLNLILFTVVFTLGVYYASQMQIIEERWHIIQFGLLGWLVAKDSDGIKNSFGRFMFSILFGFLVASLDEAFQFYLPNRVADVRDILSGSVGSIWGAMLYLSVNDKKENTKNA